ncbi:MAG: hypothetical protein CAF42_009625 [Nitrospira sp. CG24B]|nr:MAG: hypothetical protein CAF42_009625 [Nitrospira sp. CG24B]
MQSRRPISTVQWEEEEFGYQCIARPQFRLAHVPVSPLPSPPIAMRPQILVRNLFKSVKAIQHIDDGYALQFHRSENLEDLIGIMADYIVFESLNSPQLTFAIVEEPPTKAFGLQVRGLEIDGHDVTSLSIPSDSAVPPLV